MLRPLDELVAEVAASIDVTRLRSLQKAIPAALRVSAYFARSRPGYLNELAEQDKIDFEDFLTLLSYHGISSEQYEG